MIFYVLLAVIAVGVFLVSYRYPSTEKTISLSLLSLLVLIGGFRDTIGWDYYNYTTWYLNGTRDDGFEFGFLGLMKVCRYFNIDYHFLFFLVAFFTYFFAYLGIRKYTKNSSLPLVLYVFIPVLFLYSFTYIRQYLSVAIAFYAFNCLLEKKYLIYFMLMFLGISIHYTCLIPFVFFTIVYIWGSQLKIKYLYAVLIFSLILSQFGVIHILSILLKDSHYSYYVIDKFSLPVPILKLFVFNVVGAFVIWYYNRNGFKDEKQKFFLILYIVSILILNLFYESTELTRIYIYFRIFEILLIADIINDALFKRKYVLVSVFIFCFYLIPYFRAIKIDYEMTPRDQKLIPYKTLLLPGVNFN
ncbi:MAG TPA: EpsG family protein [Flavobacterium sp.]